MRNVYIYFALIILTIALLAVSPIAPTPSAVAKQTAAATVKKDSLNVSLALVTTKRTGNPLPTQGTLGTEMQVKVNTSMVKNTAGTTLDVSLEGIAISVTTRIFLKPKRGGVAGDIFTTKATTLNFPLNHYLPAGSAILTLPQAKDKDKKQSKGTPGFRVWGCLGNIALVGGTCAISGAALELREITHGKSLIAGAALDALFATIFLVKNGKALIGGVGQQFKARDNWAKVETTKKSAFYELTTGELVQERAECQFQAQGGRNVDHTELAVTVTVKGSVGANEPVENTDSKTIRV